MQFEEEELEEGDEEVSVVAARPRVGTRAPPNHLVLGFQEQDEEGDDDDDDEGDFDTKVCSNNLRFKGNIEVILQHLVDIID